MVLLITGFVQRQLFIYVNSYFYTFALLNVLNWARNGSFMQSLSAADLGYGFIRLIFLLFSKPNIPLFAKSLQVM